MIPAFYDALTDRQLRGGPRELYFWLFQQLDVVEWRPMKLDVIVLGAHLNRQTVADGLRRLLECGYLRRRGPDRRRLYRLVHSRAPHASVPQIVLAVLPKS